MASEVRALAGRSAEAAKNQEPHQRQRGKVEHGTALVDQAGTTMNEVVSSIKRVTDIMGEISAASNDNPWACVRWEAVSSMDQTTQQNAALVENGRAASSLKSQAQELVQTVAVFKLAHDQAAPAKMQCASGSSAKLPGRRAPRRWHTARAAARKPAAAAKPSRTGCSASAAPKLAAAPKPAAAAPAASAGDDDGWETF